MSIVSNVTWEQVDYAAKEVAWFVKDADWKPTVVVGLVRGGVVPASLVAKYLGVKNLDFIQFSLSSNTEIALVSNVQDFLSKYHDQICEKKVKFLFVDDISDTGKTQLFLDHFVSTFEKMEKYTVDYKFVTLVWKDVPKPVEADFSCLKVMEEEWVVFPWEMDQND